MVPRLESVLPLLNQARRWRDQIGALDLGGLPLVQVKAMPTAPVQMSVEKGRVRFFAGGASPSAQAILHSS